MKVKWQITPAMSNRVLSSTGIPSQLSRGVREVMMFLKFPNGLFTKDFKASVAPSTLLSNFSVWEGSWFIPYNLPGGWWQVEYHAVCTGMCAAELLCASPGKEDGAQWCQVCSWPLIGEQVLPGLRMSPLQWCGLCLTTQGATLPERPWCPQSWGAEHELVLCCGGLT